MKKLKIKLISIKKKYNIKLWISAPHLFFFNFIFGVESITDVSLFPNWPILPRSWFPPYPKSSPHYCLCPWDVYDLWMHNNLATQSIYTWCMNSCMGGVQPTVSGGGTWVIGWPACWLNSWSSWSRGQFAY